MSGEKDILLSHLAQAERALVWLKRSFKKCEQIDFSKELTIDQYDALENLTSRFARLTDLLTNKVFRSLDEYELEPQKSVIDVLRKAAKRRLGDEKVLRELKELRNAIAHEYADTALLEIFKNVFAQTPSLIAVFDSTKKYIESLR